MNVSKLDRFSSCFKDLRISYFSALLCDFIFEDGNIGNWLFQQIIEDELRKAYDHPAVRVSVNAVVSVM